VGSFDRNAPGTAALEPPVEHSELDAMFRGMVQHQQLIRDAMKLGLQPRHFNGKQEQGFYYLFAALVNLTEKFEVVTHDMLITELSAWEQGDVFSAVPGVFAFLCGTPETPGFVTHVFTKSIADEQALRAERSYAESILQRFVRSRVIRDGLRLELAAGGASGVPTHLNESLQLWTNRAQAVNFIGRPVVNNAAMPEFGTEILLPPKPEVTGIPWIDNYTGGFRPGDIIGCVGPYSGGKTTLLAIAAVRTAQNYHARGQNKLSVFIGYEDGGSKMNHLFWSAAAHIERRLFEAGEDFWTSFSDSSALKDYDRHLPENKNGKVILGERERWELARVWLNKHFLSLDFSANSVSGPGLGSGGVEEIVSTLVKLRDETGMDIGFVAIDYAGLLLNRYLSSNPRTKHAEQIWREVQALPDELKTRIAVPLGATVMLAHQLAGSDIKNRPVYRYVDHLDCQGSKAFAENLHSCLCINKRDSDTGVSTINWSKIRARVPVTPFGLIQMDKVVVNVHLVNDEYSASETSRRIVKRGESGLVTPDAEIAKNLAAKKKSQAARGLVDNFGGSLIDGDTL